ncbi:hypothetical protein [Haloglomus halophilum]|uniref:hypothetical protein n=1 Tax=Haloglomus halophilum TaxID=2962672 RepID=UPI0020C984CD|nr:hypothetical protein [Haloglomus halophilum]
MTDDLKEDYPEAAEYILKAVEDHSEEWVIDNYWKIRQLGVVMDVPDVDELPFFDEEKHHAPTDEELREQAEALSQYRENLKKGSKSADDT